mmetsp:Transcript_36760/g.104637  ORF Transcript_36760/g.104637 Transcript_36760/m.104637 type:complete len:419 (-) Transcript_36760:992-2248(-)
MRCFFSVAFASFDSSGAPLVGRTATERAPASLARASSGAASPAPSQERQATARSTQSSSASRRACSAVWSLLATDDGSLAANCRSANFRLTLGCSAPSCMSVPRRAWSSKPSSYDSRMAILFRRSVSKARAINCSSCNLFRSASSCNAASRWASRCCCCLIFSSSTCLAACSCFFSSFAFSLASFSRSFFSSFRSSVCLFSSSFFCSSRFFLCSSAFFSARSRSAASSANFRSLSASISSGVSSLGGFLGLSSSEPSSLLSSGEMVLAPEPPLRSTELSVMGVAPDFEISLCISSMTVGNSSLSCLKAASKWSHKEFKSSTSNRRQTSCNWSALTAWRTIGSAPLCKLRKRWRAFFRTSFCSSLIFLSSALLASSTLLMASSFSRMIRSSASFLSCSAFAAAAFAAFAASFSRRTFSL